MKILIITQKVDESDDVLGFFTSWVKAIAKRVDGVDVICLAKGVNDLPINVAVSSLGKEKGYPKFIQAIIFYFHLIRILPKVDGVFVHMAPEYVRAIYPLNIFFKKPIVMWYAHIKVSPTAKWAIDHVDHILTPSKESFEYDSNKVIATGHGINTEVFKPIGIESKHEVLSLGRISKVKRIETLIEAVRVLKDRGKSVVVNIYGKPVRPEDHEYMTGLKSRISKYQLERNFIWKGGVANKDAPKVYAEHKVFVRTQGGGGFGKVDLEAMSMGIPMILPTEVYKKDLGEFAEDTYFKEDDAHALADRIEKVLGWDENKRAQYAKLSRKIVVDKHNVENVAESIVNSISG